ncbi:MAG: glycosyltransferase family 4 protein [Microthrixaceae bacterium]
MLRVTCLVHYPTDLSPGQRFRFEQWLRLLPEGSVRVELRPLFSASAYRDLYEPGHTPRKVAHTAGGWARRLRDVVAPGRPDVVLLYREAFPFGPPLFEWFVERRLPVVFDFDDAVYLPNVSDANRAVAALKRPGKTARIVAGSTITTVGNAHLAEYARRFGDHVTILPTTLDVKEYRPEARTRPTGGRLRIGWSGSPTTAPHLSSIANALRRALPEVGAELDIVGAPRFAVGGLPDFVARPWSRETEILDVSGFDVGLMPLPDDEWSRGKCGFKVLLYMALGVPVVASPVGVNTEIVEDGVNGLLASTEDEWVEAIKRLAAGPGLRRRLADAGRTTVVERYSGQGWAPRFLEVLEKAASTR